MKCYICAICGKHIPYTENFSSPLMVNRCMYFLNDQDKHVLKEHAFKPEDLRMDVNVWVKCDGSNCEYNKKY